MASAQISAREVGRLWVREREAMANSPEVVERRVEVPVQGPERVAKVMREPTEAELKEILDMAVDIVRRSRSDHVVQKIGRVMDGI